jgi:succinyl-diaminopimelate desuccinylase
VDGVLGRRVLASVDEEAVIEFTRDLIRLDSTNPPGCEWPVAEAIQRQAHEWKLDADLTDVDEGRSNVRVTLPGSWGGKKRLMYCGHLDTVPVGQAPWDRDPLGAELEDGYIWGRGSVDMKGGIAAMLGALAALRRAEIELPGDVVFAGVVGEEVNCAGSRHHLEHGGMDGVGWLVVAEPTNLDVVVAHKGAMRLEATARGKGAHSSKPELGVNAIVHLTKFIDRLTSIELAVAPHAFLTPPTLSVNTIAGGSAINVVPDRCTAVVDIRTLPGQSHREVFQSIEGLARELTAEDQDFSVHLSVLGEVEPVETSADHPLVGAAQDAAAMALGSRRRIRGATFFSDASVLQPPTQVPTVVFGPGDDSLAHQTNEHVSVQSVIDAARLLAVLPLTLWHDSPAVASEFDQGVEDLL